MMEYRLDNGKKLFIKGNRFQVDIDKDGNTHIKPMSTDSYIVDSNRVEDIFGNFDKPAISPEPSPVVSFSEIQSQKDKVDEKMAEGMRYFSEFVDTWKINFRVENAEQPDRTKLMNEIMSYHSGAIMKFIKHCGGLTHAIFAVSEDDDINDKDDRMHNRLLAENIAQVSSILFPPISELLEYPFKI